MGSTHGTETAVALREGTRKETSSTFSRVGFPELDHTDVTG